MFRHPCDLATKSYAIPLCKKSTNSQDTICPFSLELPLKSKMSPTALKKRAKKKHKQKKIPFQNKGEKDYICCLQENLYDSGIVGDGRNLWLFSLEINDGDELSRPYQNTI